MAKMSLGSYEFEWDPYQFTIPQTKKSYSVVQTYASYAYFSWGNFLAGQQIVLEWDMMKLAQFTQLDTQVTNDASLVWDLGDGTQYNVRPLRLDGKYVERSIIDAAYRSDVKLTLLIESAV